MLIEEQLFSMEWNLDRYGWRLESELEYGELEPLVRDALIAEGFGFPMEIAVHEVMKEKLGVDRPYYRILGACHPPSADKIAGMDPAIGVLLPCNVVVRQRPEGGSECVMIDVAAMVGFVGMDGFQEVADKVGGMLERSRTTISNKLISLTSV